jgi:hypothetical protein
MPSYTLVLLLSGLVTTVAATTSASSTPASARSLVWAWTSTVGEIVQQFDGANTFLAACRTQRGRRLLLIEPFTRQGFFLEEVDGKVGNLVELSVDVHGLSPGEIHGGVGSVISTNDALQEMLTRSFRWVASSELQGIAGEQPTQRCEENVKK